MRCFRELAPALFARTTAGFSDSCAIRFFADLNDLLGIIGPLGGLFTS